jgi:tetratricopeptide (TPR) repeat protein
LILRNRNVEIKVKHFGILFVVIAIFSGCQLGTRIQGEYYLNQEKYDEGIKKFDEKLKTDSFDASANYYMARYLLALNRPKGAYPYIKEAVSLDFKNADYHFWLGVCYHGLKRYQEERKSYLKAIEFNNRHITAYLYLGNIYLDNGQWGKALGAYDKVLEIEKDQPQAMYNRGLALNKLHRFAEEIAAWKDYLKVYSEGGWAIQAVDHLNARGNFDYRNYFIGYRRVPVKKMKFEGTTSILTNMTKSSIDIIGSILSINKKIDLRIVGYKNGNKSLAKKRATNIKEYLVTNYPEIDSSRLTIEGVGAPEKITIIWKIFSVDDSINLITVKK